MSLGVASCVKSERGADGKGSDTFAFAGSADPASLDPVFTTDAASAEVAYQIFEGLVGTKPGTANPVPLLATSWKVGKDRLTYDFRLRRGVTFQDGTPFDAAAVCDNFDRWYNLPKTAQSPNFAYYYGYLFRGFRTGDNADKAIYRSCEAKGAHEAVIHLKQPFANFITALSMPQFVMQSPAALKKYQRDGAANPNNTTYSTSKPVGTGPFTFRSWDKGQRLTLVRNDTYWGEKAKVSRAVVVPIGDAKARVTALRNGEVNAADLIGPKDAGPLKKDGFQVKDRPPFTVLYLGLNQAVKPLNDIRVRRAIAYAIDKKAVIRGSLPQGTEPTSQFLPPGVKGWTSDVPRYDYNPAKARELLKEAGAEGATVQFDFPTDVSRPYLPSPEDTFNVLRSQLEAVGLKVKPVSTPWSPDYVNKIYGTADHGIHVLGWIGQTNMADDFIGLAFGFPTPEWGFKDKKLFADLAEARDIPDPKEQTRFYQGVSKEIMRKLPGVPLANPPSSVALSAGVSGFTPSPIGNEAFNTISLH
ncbi:ABC transporter substrate-binding protein [Streptomyces sp. NPDC048425]|uniref:ABC transporter substrate-binding protein n=1 Tax=Streptomyces sp. NPDC048425 TaxID=3365548 RepID=UPI003722419D